MRKEIQQLLIVQDRDNQIKSLEKDLTNSPQLIAAAKKRLADDEKAVEDAKAASMEIEKAIKTLELDVDTRKTTINRLKVQQFETRKNEEFTALGNEIVRYENEISDLEDKELEQMEQLESAKATLAEKREALGKVEAVVARDVAQLEERIANRKTQLDEFIKDRAEKIQDIDEEWLALYERLLIRKPPGVVPIDHSDTCGGCHMKLIGNAAAEARADKGVVQCGNCGRILYMPA